MRKTAATATVMWALSCCLVGATQNFLRNPSFEDPSRSDDYTCDQAAHWGRWGHWINRETGWDPTRSGKCLIGYHYWKIHGNDDSGIYQDAKGPRAGKACTFSVYATRDKGTNADEIELRLEPYGGGPTVASETYRVRKLDSEEWTPLSVTGTCESEGLRVLVIVKPKRGGTRQGAVKFDDAELIEADSNSAPRAGR